MGGPYGADPGVIGRSVTINGAPATVVGVMREGFEFPFRQALWLPLALFPGIEKHGRDEPVLACSAGSRTASILTTLEPSSPPSRPTSRDPIDRIQPVVVRFGVQQVGRLRDQQPPLLLLATAVFVLLIACANVANLLLARSAGRSREIAIRTSIGATRWRIVRQLMVESLMLSLLSGALGVWLSRFGVQFVAEAFGRNIPYWMHFPVDGRVVAILVGLCIACTLAFGLGPALVVSRTDAGGLMREGGRTGIAPRVGRWTKALLVAELAVTVTLLAGAGLMVRSFLAVYRADRVIDPSNVLTMEIALPEEEYRTPAERSTFYRQLDDGLGGHAGLAAASLASTRPFIGGPSQQVSFLDRPMAAGESQPPVVVIEQAPATSRHRRFHCCVDVLSTLSTAHQVIRRLWSTSGSWTCFSRTTIP